MLKRRCRLRAEGCSLSTASTTLTQYCCYERGCDRPTPATLPHTEAYDLGEGTYGKEALTKLLSMLTEPEFMGKTVVVLAGYNEEMHLMLERNPGLKSRFKQNINFPDWKPTKCVELVEKMAKGAKPEGYELDDDARDVLEHGFEALIRLPGWANARDALRMFSDLECQRELRCGRGEGTAAEESKARITAADAQQAVAQFLRDRPEATTAHPEDGRATSGGGATTRLPPSNQLRQNMRVEVGYNVSGDGQTIAWFPGTVVAMRKRTNEVDVLLLADGTIETDLPIDDRNRVRSLGVEAAQRLFPDKSPIEGVGDAAEGAAAPRCMPCEPPRAPPQQRRKQTHRQAKAAPAAEPGEEDESGEEEKGATQDDEVDNDAEADDDPFSNVDLNFLEKYFEKTLLKRGVSSSSLVQQGSVSDFLINETVEKLVADGVPEEEARRRVEEEVAKWLEAMRLAEERRLQEEAELAAERARLAEEERLRTPIKVPNWICHCGRRWITQCTFAGPILGTPNYFYELPRQ